MHRAGPHWCTTLVAEFLASGALIQVQAAADAIDRIAGNRCRCDRTVVARLELLQLGEVGAIWMTAPRECDRQREPRKSNDLPHCRWSVCCRPSAERLIPLPSA